MPLTAADLQAGDLVLCYGWNAVGAAQGAAKSLTRLGQLATLPLSVPLYLASGPRVWGDADCNHALLVGDPQANREVDTEVFKVIVDGSLRGDPKFDFSQGRTLLCYTDDSGKHESDLADKCVILGKPSHLACDRPKNRNHVIRVLWQSERTVLSPRVAHSTGGGCVWSDARSYLEQHTGQLSVFRLRDQAVRDRLATRAGRVAITWATDLLSRGYQHPSQYSMRKAFASIFGTSSYGSNARARAAKYRTHRATAGGPPSDMKWGLSGNKTGKKEWFCSMFAIACYQAATNDDAEVAVCLPLDARHTTPMLLDGFVRNSPLWQRVGSLP
jgi:hypothetical protein